MPLSNKECTNVGVEGQDLNERASSNVLSRRLNKILETRLENDKDTLEALKELSTFFTENTLQARRNLRSKIEKRSLAINEMACFVYSDFSQKLCLQQEVAGAFLQSFQLSPAEQSVLRGASREAAITNEFFAVLDRVQNIHSNGRMLMQSGHQTAALEIMEQMALYQVVPGSMLQSTIEELQELSQQTFLLALQGQVRQQLSERVETPPSDLSPSPGVSQLLNLLREVLSVGSVAEGRQQDFIKIVAYIVDPLLQAVNESATRLPTTDMAVYLLNCLYQMQSTLSLYEFMDERLERLQGKLDGFLVMPDMLLLPQIGLLLSSVHRSTVQRRAFEVIAAVYRQLYEAVHDPENLYKNPDVLMPRTPDQVSKLLIG
ncbi:hypothetical protein C0J52_16472 [Blattella germanica]|nr:hypothetical protein C0J52_16472 [Blattella germanica]